MSHSHSIINNGTETFVLVVAPEGLFNARSDHPNFAEILRRLQNTDDEGLPAPDYDGIEAQFDVATAITERFQRLSRRVTVRGGKVYLDGDEADEAITRQILRFVEDGHDFAPLVNFYERIQSNPSDNSRAQLYSWIGAQDDTVTITDAGTMIAYKGVESDGKGGFQSTKVGTAIVDGETINGKIPNYVGAAVEMPRSTVADRPEVACSTGLHVGTFDYATQWSRSGVTLKVEVDPADVVSVPNDAGGQKVRVCRYKVLDIVEGPVKDSLVRGFVQPDDEVEWAVGDRGADADGDEFVVLHNSVAEDGVLDGDGDLLVEFDGGDELYVRADEATKIAPTPDVLL
jgi:hypothetical protein